MNVLKAKVNGEWVPVSGPAGPAGAGVVPGGTTGQILTKKSATDYDTQWTTPTLGILPNNTYLRGYLANGTTPQDLIGVGTDDQIYLGRALVSPKAIVIPDGVSVKSASGYNFLYADTVASTIHFAAYTTDKNIYIGGGLPAPWSIYVPRLHSFGPITLFNNNTHFQGTRADGTTAQSLIGVRTDNNIALGTGLPTNGRVVLSNTVWLSGLRTNATIQDLVFVNSDDSVHVAYATPKPLYLGQAAQDDIFIGGSLAAGKHIYVPRIWVQGPLYISSGNWLMDEFGKPIAAGSADGNIYFANSNIAVFNSGGGYTTFEKDLQVRGILYKAGVGAYTFPDFVFEHHFTGGIERFRDAPGADTYEGLWPLSRVEKFAEENWRLPGHASREHDKVDIFRRTHDLLAELERVYLHLFEHEKRLAALEER